MPWDIVVKRDRIYVQDKNGKLLPKGGYPNTPAGRARAREYQKALYANVKEK